jgi:NAD(P)-dependent dehydrogenase (short-subunit alcohol dehydrogenase family)
VLADIPLHRIGDPEADIGHAVVFLATTTYVTGRTLMVDGGGGEFM